MLKFVGHERTACSSPAGLVVAGRCFKPKLQQLSNSAKLEANMAVTTASRPDTTAELAERIIQHARQLPRAYLLTPERLSQFGDWATVEPAVQLLLSESEMFEVYDQIYVAGWHSKFGIGLPFDHELVRAYAELAGETIVCSPGVAANMMRMCDQLCVKATYLTSGP